MSGSAVALPTQAAQPLAAAGAFTRTVAIPTFKHTATSSRPTPIALRLTSLLKGHRGARWPNPLKQLQPMAATQQEIVREMAQNIWRRLHNDGRRESPDLDNHHLGASGFTLGDAAAGLIRHQQTGGAQCELANTLPSRSSNVRHTVDDSNPLPALSTRSAEKQSVTAFSALS